MTKKTNVSTEVETVEQKLVDEAYEKLVGIFSENFEKAIMSAGKYLIETFYSNDIELARKKKSPKELTLNKLIEKCKTRTTNSPSKSWIYNAIGLVVQDHDIEKSTSEKCFQTYGKLLLSHKILLMPVPEIKQKEKLILEVGTKNLTIEEFKALKMKKGTPNNRTPGHLTILRNPEELINNSNRELFEYEKLSEIPIGRLEIIKSRATKMKEDFEIEIETIKNTVATNEKHIDLYSGVLENIEKAINENKAPGRGKQKSKK